MGGGGVALSDLAAGDQPSPLTAHLLGPVRLATGGRVLSDEAWPRRSARSLLLLLLATPGHRLPRDQILDLLWPEAPPKVARNALALALHALRRVLEPDLQAGRSSAYVEATGEVIALRPHPGFAVDVDAFAAGLAEARAAAPPDRREPLRRAVALYEGDLLAGEPSVDWPIPRRDELRRAWQRAVLELADLDFTAGEPSASVPALEALVAVEPTEEAAHRALLRVHLATGRRDLGLRQYDRCVQALRDELGVEPEPATQELATALRGLGRPAPAVIPSVPPPPDLRPAPLPTPATPLVGRAREVDHVQDLLWRRDVHLVTLTGAGGTGKTRLALEVAANVAGDFADGVCFVALAALADPALVPSTIVRALGVPEVTEQAPIETVREALRERELLLVLDNFEHLMPAAVPLAELLATCPRLTMLVTSREPLRLLAEHEVPVPPLALPELAAPIGRPPGSAGLSRVEAVALFVQRAQAVKPDFALTDGNAAEVAEVCRRLDGLPLALELAAARVKVLPPAALLGRLERRLPLLTGGPRDLPPRQRTMRDAIAWSHDLLSPAEQALFRRLAVVAGDCSLEAAEALGSGIDGLEGGVLDAVTSLVDKSLLHQVERDSTTRFAMFETIREYALDQLDATAEGSAARHAHAAYYLDLAEAAGPALAGPRQAECLARLELEHDNFRAALRWSLESGDAERAVRFAAALWLFWWVRGHLREGRDWLARVLARDDGGAPAIRAHALTGAGTLAETQGDYDQAVRLHQEALALRQAIGDKRGVAESLESLGSIAQDQGDYPRATRLHEQALALCREVGDERGIAHALVNLGTVAAYRGDADRAAALLTEGLGLLRALKDPRGVSTVVTNLGSLAFRQGDDDRATALFEEALTLWRELGDKQGIALALLNLGGAVQQRGDLERATALYAQALPLLEEIGDRRGIAVALLDLGRVARAQGNQARAAALLTDGLDLCRETGDRAELAACLEGLAGVATALGRAAAAGRLFGAAEALREAIETPLPATYRADYERDVAAARAQLPGDAFATAWAAGRGRPLEQVILEAGALRG